MGNSLLDQLKKAGLVDEKQAKKGLQEKRRQERRQRKNKTNVSGEEKRRLRQIQAEKAKRDRELNLQRKQQAELKAGQAQIDQLIEMNRRSGHEGDVPYNFTDGKIIKTIHVSEAIHKQLGLGRLVIARLKGGYELVPAAVAEKICLRDKTRVIQCGGPRQSDEDDYYADYKVPDDLMW